MTEQTEQELEQQFVEETTELAAIPLPIQHQSFFRIKGTYHIVQTEQEYNYLVTRGANLEVVTYGQAVESLRQQDAQARQRKVDKLRKKRSRKARKRNRA